MVFALSLLILEGFKTLPELQMIVMLRSITKKRCIFTIPNASQQMILLDRPYISDFLLETIQQNNIRVLETSLSTSLLPNNDTLLVSNDKAISLIANQQELLYTNSENAIGWISENLKNTNLPQHIELFKNKEKFRTLISTLFPNFYYRKVAFNALGNLNIDTLPIPFVIKPNVGFFSMGVHTIKTKDDWENALTALQLEMKSANDIYPVQVMDATEFIIESYVEGQEYAIDCYFNAQGKPVLLNILEHQFSSDDDVSDRLYFTSINIIKKLKEKVLQFLTRLNALAGLTHFPLHIEMRIDNDGVIIPIEGNPMRFGGWCTTADLAYHAYGFNPYLYYFKQQAPDWDTIVKRKDDAAYSVIILNNATGLEARQIKAFNYDKLLSCFEHPIELRKIDYTQFPLFGFLFTKTSNHNFKELDNILLSDLREFVVAK